MPSDPFSNYENASALIITFLVNNFVDAEFQEKAAMWEAEFIRHVRKYQQRKDLDYNISFMAEVC